MHHRATETTEETRRFFDFLCALCVSVVSSFPCRGAESTGVLSQPCVWGKDEVN